MDADWDLSKMPRQDGRSSIITGTGGLGFETALALAAKGGDVILAGRNAEKGAASVAKIRTAVAAARVSFELLDLASLASIESFGYRVASSRASIDLLVNNAGVMAPSTRKTTADGFELQFGTNYLGHFALTARMLPLLLRGKSPRLVNVSSLAHRHGAIHFEDLQWEKSYKRWAAYGQSKLAMLMFAMEFQRRSDAAGWGIMSNAAHPGVARTDLMSNGPGTDGIGPQLMMRLFEPWGSQSAADGALPTLFAATSPDAVGGAYYGPSSIYELKGPPKRAKIMPKAGDRSVAGRLWNVSEQLTDVRIEFDARTGVAGVNAPAN